MTSGKIENFESKFFFTRLIVKYPMTIFLVNILILLLYKYILLNQELKHLLGIVHPSKILKSGVKNSTNSEQTASQI